MKSISLLLLLLCTLGAQSKAQDLEPQFNLYFKKNTLETLNLNDIQRSTLQAIIQNAELDKQVDAEYANGTQGIFGDLSRTVPYTGNEIFNIAINSGKIGSENFTLKPIYLAYGRDLNLRRIEFESKIKGVRARLHIFMEGEGKFASTQVYYELVINTKGKEIYIKLSKNWHIIKATETQQKKIAVTG